MPAGATDDDRAATLSAFDVGCVVVGGIIGVGIFFTPAEVARRVDGPAQVMVAWALGGLVALLGALVFAELSCRLPGHGGSWRYVRAAFGEGPAFLYGWANAVVIQAGGLGVIGLVLVDNLDVLLFGTSRSTPFEKAGLAALAIALFTALNAFGLRAGKRAQNLLTVAKTAAVLLLVGLALWVETRGGGARLPVVAGAAASPRGWPTALAAAILPVLFSYGGWQQASFLAGAARRPLRDVPLGLVGGVVIVVAAYLAVNLAFLDLLGLSGARASEAIAADAARAALATSGHGELAGRLLAGMVVISAAGILNTVCMASPYVLAAMAQEGLLPRVVGRLHAGTGAPVVAILVQGLWGVVLLLGVAALAGSAAGASLGFLLDGVVCVDWFFYGLCAAALLKLRSGPRHEGFRAPAGGAVAGLFCLFAAAVTVGAVAGSPFASLTGLGVSALGALVYARGPGRRVPAG